MLSATEIRSALETDGYVVLPSILTREECELHLSQVWDFVEGVSPTVKRDQPLSWRPHWPIGQHGLVQHYGVGWNAASRAIRQKVLPIFSAFYGTEALHCSFDGLNFTRPPVRNKDGRPRYTNAAADWSHFDQDGRLLGLHNVQASVNLVDQEEGDACFQCWPRSWEHHPSLVPAGQNLGHWFKLTDANREVLRQHGLAPRRVPVAAGSMILWRSESAHSGAPALSGREHHDRWRAVIFVCCQPASRTVMTDRSRAVRTMAFAQQRTSTHTGRLFPQQPRTYGQPDLCHRFAGENPPLTDLERRLYGVDPWPEMVQTTECEPKGRKQKRKRDEPEDDAAAK